MANDVGSVTAQGYATIEGGRAEGFDPRSRNPGFGNAGKGGQQENECQSNPYGTK